MVQQGNSRKHPVYFCFHAERDRQRALHVSALTGTVDQNRLSDWTDESWEAAAELGEQGLQELIDEKLGDSAVTCLLVGERTFEKPWIGAMLQRSLELERGILAIHVHDIPDENGNTVKKGPNPMGRLTYPGRDRQQYPFTSAYPTYDWKHSDGDRNVAAWIEKSMDPSGTGID